MKKRKGLFLIILALAIILINIKQKNKGNEKNIVIEPVQPKYEYGILVDSLDVTKGVVQKGQTFGEILYANHIDHQEIAKIVSQSKDIFDFRRVNTGKEYTVICTKDSIKKRVISFIKKMRQNMLLLI